MERELGLTLCTNYVYQSHSFCLKSQKEKAARYHTDKLRYRGVTYKEIG